MQVYRKRPTDRESHVEEYDPSKMTVPYVHYSGRESAFLMKKGKVKKDCSGIWQHNGPRSVFYSCPFCSAINKSTVVARQSTQSSGYADSVWCVRCERHLRLFYEGTKL